MNIDNTTSRVFSLNAIYTQDYRNKKIGSVLKEISAKRYGRRRDFVDAEISARLGISLDSDDLVTDTLETGDGQQEA